ncbi:hypothetical protein [Aminobacter ciceronei]|nr:hypothetical protein [Aminobacter ciceronei]MBA8910261.1 hypothetical protein [Aminobacter ciceronei]
MMMTPHIRKFVLTAHITSSVGLIGAIGGFLALSVAGLTSQTAELVRAAYLAMELTAWFVILPLAFVSLLIGIVQSLGTPWGLFRYYWIVAKLLLTVLAIAVLLLQMRLISDMADVAAGTALTAADFWEARMSLVVHAGGGLLVLLVPMVLSVYKPQGRTRYGRRKREEPQLLSQP